MDHELRHYPQSWSLALLLGRLRLALFWLLDNFLSGHLNSLLLRHFPLDAEFLSLNLFVVVKNLKENKTKN